MDIYVHMYICIICKYYVFFILAICPTRRMSVHPHSPALTCHVFLHDQITQYRQVRFYYFWGCHVINRIVDVCQ